MREIRMLRSTWRGLETWHGRGISDGAGAPALDPTDVEGTGNVARSRGLPARQSSTLPEILRPLLQLRQNASVFAQGCTGFSACSAVRHHNFKHPPWWTSLPILPGLGFSVHTVCPSDGETGTSGQVMGHAPKNRHSQDDNLARAAAKISFETFGSATILEIVSAPSIVARNTLADFFARSVPGSFIRSATSAIILRIPLVAADRVDLSDLASSLPSAARGHP